MASSSLPCASAEAAPTPRSRAGWVEAGVFYHNVTNHYRDWKGVALRAVVPQGKNLWYADVVGQEAFGDQGVWFSAANRHAFGPAWFTYVGVGGGTGDYYFNDLRVDLQVGHAWLKQRNVVTTVGTMDANSKSVYEDVALTGSIAAYFPGVTIEGGGRINWSSPGSVNTGRGYGAITVGRERQRFITLRAGGGYEGYQLTGDEETRLRSPAPEDPPRPTCPRRTTTRGAPPPGSQPRAGRGSPWARCSG